MASSISVHGTFADTPLNENSPSISPCIYGASKLLSESLLSTLLENVPRVSLRLPAVVGLGATKSWIPNMIRQATSSQEIKYHSPEQQFNHAIHVDDLSAFIAHILLASNWNGHRAFPIGAASPINISCIVNRIAEHIPNIKTCLLDTACPPPSAIISSSFAEKHFGYRPRNMIDVLNKYMTEAL